MLIFLYVFYVSLYLTFFSLIIFMSNVYATDICAVTKTVRASQDFIISLLHISTLSRIVVNFSSLAHKLRIFIGAEFARRQNVCVSSAAAVHI